MTRRFFSRMILAMVLIFGPVEIPAYRADPSLRAVFELVVGGPVTPLFGREQR